MQISAVKNNQTNTNFKASFGVIGNKGLLSKDVLSSLSKKAESIGSSKDIITVGLAHKAEVVPYDSMNPNFGKLTFFHQATEITGIAHTFFNVKEPGNFIRNVAKFVGSEKERADKVFNVINKYLDELKKSVEKK